MSGSVLSVAGCNANKNNGNDDEDDDNDDDVVPLAVMQMSHEFFV
jgi:hypothetical protein